MSRPTISGWPAWRVAWVLGTFSTVVLLVVGISSVTDTASSCPGVDGGFQGQLSESWGGASGILCPQGVMSTTHPHELRGLLLIAIAMVWALITIVVANDLRPRRRVEIR